MVFLWAEAVLAAWWAGQWPGLLSPDSVRYIIQVTTGPWVASHSVLYDSFVLASLHLTGNVAVLTFLQTVAASAVIAFAVGSVHALGVRARWAALPGILVPCVPSVGAFVSTVWKDVPFALMQVLVAATVIRLVARRRRGVGRPTSALLVSLGLEFFGLAMFRNDGFLVLAALAVLLAAGLPRVRLKVLGLAAAALVLFMVCETVIYPAVGIGRLPASEAYGTFYGDIAVAYADAPSIFTPADKALMAQVTPLKDWRRANNCYDSDKLFHRPWNVAAATRLKNQLAVLWFKSFARAPVLMARTRFCRGSAGWDPFPPPRAKTGFGELPVTVPAGLYHVRNQVPPDVAANIQPAPLSTRLGDLTTFLRRIGYQHRIVQVLLFRGANWCYGLYVVLLFVAWRCRRWDVLVIGATSLACQLVVIAINPAQLYRYMSGPILVGMLLVPLAATRRSVRGTERAPRAGAAHARRGQSPPAPVAGVAGDVATPVVPT